MGSEPLIFVFEQVIGPSRQSWFEAEKNRKWHRPPLAEIKHLSSWAIKTRFLSSASNLNEKNPISRKSDRISDFAFTVSVSNLDVQIIFESFKFESPAKKSVEVFFCPVQTLPTDRRDEVDGSHFWVNILTFRRTPPSVNVFEAFFESLERQRERKKAQKFDLTQFSKSKWK